MQRGAPSESLRVDYIIGSVSTVESCIFVCNKSVVEQRLKESKQVVLKFSSMLVWKERLKYSLVGNLRYYRTPYLKY